jgi:hypothetical protein
VFRAAAARGDRVANCQCILYPERLLLWSRHFATQSPLAAAARNTFPCQLQTLRVFLTIVVYRVIVGSLVNSLQTCESVTFFLNCPAEQSSIPRFTEPRYAQTPRVYVRDSCKLGLMRRDWLTTARCVFSTLTM